MTYLLMPGRHIVQTQFQERYLDSVLSRELQANPEIIGNAPIGPIQDIIFAVTSCDKSNSRYNPLPLEIRTILIYEFARVLKEKHGVGFHIFSISHYQPVDDFAEIVLKEINRQSSGQMALEPNNAVIFTSNPAMIGSFRNMGFAVLPSEYDPVNRSYHALSPHKVVQQIGNLESPLEKAFLSQSALAVFQHLPDLPQRIVKIFHDPILAEPDDLTESPVYASSPQVTPDDMNLKYREIKDYIKPGKIIDDGCADGMLIAQVVRDFPDSDIIGIDHSAEMLAHAEESKRTDAFGEAFVFFKQASLTYPVTSAMANTADTIICNSTLHEIWSYQEKQETVREYLQSKYKQLHPNGRIIIRDLVGPDEGDRLVYLWCDPSDGANAAVEQDVSQLSTQSRFMRFTKDFQRSPINLQAHYDPLIGDILFRLPLRDAMEFIMKKDYTDNWTVEMHEEYCFWSFAEWKRALMETGFRILVGSRAFVNAWRVQNHFQKKVQLFDLSLTPLDFPETNMILIGEKPV